MTRVYMIRHGKPEATWGEHAADPDPGLDAQGRVQAAEAAAWLKALEPHRRPVRIVTSPLRRCVETAEPFAQVMGLRPLLEPAVAEVPTPKDLTPPERGPWLRAAFLGSWEDMGGDISYRAWRDGVAEAVVRHAGAAIFSHFVAINAAVSAALGNDKVANFQPDHASVTVFEVTDGVLTLVELGRPAATRVL